MEGQNNNQSGQTYPTYISRAQERYERHMAKQAARQARHAAHEAARAQRVHRDWTFEFRAGDKVYTFNWRWQPANQPQENTAPSQAEAPVAPGVETPEEDQ